MTCRIRFSVIAASIMLAASAHAIEAKYELSDLPTLVSEPQHNPSSERAKKYFERSHYKSFSIDDSFSKEVFDRYLEKLDFNRLFLTQKEVDALSVWRYELDDQLNKGETTAAYDIFNVYLKKSFERYQFALSLIDREITFDSDEEMLIDRRELPWAKDETELDELWRLRVKNDALNLKLAGKEWPDIRETLAKRYSYALRRLTQTRSEDAFEVYMNSFALEIDPHTSYMSPRNADQFHAEMNLSLEGIGAVLQVEDDFTVIRKLVAGGPASGSNKLSPGDRIIGVAQDDAKVVDVVGWRLDDVVQLIKGPKGSKVKLEILPEGANSESYKITLIRDKIRLEDGAVKSKVIQEGSEKIGVVTIPGFYLGLTEDTKKEIAKLKKEKVSGIVIDLRYNGGGPLGEATALTGLFIGKGPVVQVRKSDGKVEVLGDNDRAIYYDGPVAVLINRYSASASEIFAAALQDYGRAVIVGEQSFGKGTVQQLRSLSRIYDLNENRTGQVTFTIQKFYRISGGSTQHLGVVPDIAFPTEVNPENAGESVEENALPWDSINPVSYSAVGKTNKLVAALDKLHQARIKNDEEFGFIIEDIAEYKARKDDNVISLNEKSRVEEREEADSKRLARLNDRQKMLGKKAFKTLDDVPSDYEKPDAYLNEAALITLDMARAK
ncbi:carboxy terminal-processing peptidase [Enterovibrio norvegicus]|uniref:C-terminal processing peptidase n=1 Tax=Enterovibrio norvegicus TaxID=188144 RepID=A0A2N7L4A2_9GAMM|nr:carboxy terminal-processing peptidase [Enterovibrio norvegicus]PMN88207.1 C-terminal processing peptidase [Enterovibrio norvegicus]